MAARILCASWVLPRAGLRIADGAVVVDRGRVVEIVAGTRACRRAERRAGVRATHLGRVVLTPGFVNAHAHLELSALAGRVRAGASFAAWIKRLLVERARVGTGELRSALQSAADRMLATGTTSVGDIDSTGVVDLVLRDHPLRVRAYREALDAGDPSRVRSAFATASRRASARTRMLAGLSPHSPYTVSEKLLDLLAALHTRRRIPVAIHWAETREECAWLEHGRGPLRALLRASPRATGLGLIARAGLLGPRTALIHGNHPAPGDLELIRASGTSVVHCPGTHAFFDREPFDIASYLRHGITVGLGTDSLASNVDLDMRREMALARASFPWLAPEDVWDMATRRSAAAIGLSARAGEIEPGAAADFCAHIVPAARSRRAMLEAMTTSGSTIAGVWVGGRAVALPAEQGLEKSLRISETRSRRAE